MIENEIWNNNPNQFVIGADEVGRGSIAGPIVAASVRLSFKDNMHLGSVKDSKKMTENKRNEIFKYINDTDIEIIIDNDLELIEMWEKLNHKVIDANNKFSFEGKLGMGYNIYNTVRRNLFSDTYLTMSNISDSDIFNIKFQKKPFMNFIWFSVLLISLGGILNFFNRKKEI